MSWQDIPRERKAMSAADRRAFNRWLTANAIAGLILAAGIIAMAVAGSNSAGPRDAMMAATKSPDAAVAASGHRPDQGGRPRLRQNARD
jgi:hypothetical protein